MKIDNVTIDLSGFPMMSQKEVDIIDNLIEKEKPERCLEWGSGNSTIYFPHKHDFIKSWLSIEHNGHYQTYLKNKIKGNTKVVWVKEEDKIDYVDYPNDVFDFILIDGKRREECLAKAYKLIVNGGIILLHDSARPHYKFINKYDHEVLCDGEIPWEGGCAHRGLMRFK